MSRRGTRQQGPEFNVIQAPELLRRLRDRFGLRQMHVAPTMLEGVQPVVVLDDLRANVTKDVRDCVGTIARTSAANFPEVWLQNPPGSPVLIRLLRFEAYDQTFAGGNDQLLVCWGVPPATLIAGVKQFQDTRLPPAPYGLVAGNDVAAPFGTQALVLPFLQTAPFAHQVYTMDNAIILPGQAIGWARATGPSNLRVNLWWQEFDVN